MRPNGGGDCRLVGLSILSFYRPNIRFLRALARREADRENEDGKDKNALHEPGIT